mmetsp:Transcript_2861/g.11378  ORF Transcript_2861/g.11378 Transcript_2861/m.11378 type:complete len:340 (+) Transcript_2861:33-1052(+)
MSVMSNGETILITPNSIPHYSPAVPELLIRASSFLTRLWIFSRESFEHYLRSPRRLRQISQRVPRNAHPVERAHDGWFLFLFSVTLRLRLAIHPERLGVPLREVREDGVTRVGVARNAKRLGDGGVPFAQSVRRKVVRECRLVHQHLHAPRRARQTPRGAAVPAVAQAEPGGFVRQDHRGRLGAVLDRNRLQARQTQRQTQRVPRRRKRRQSRRRRRRGRRDRDRDWDRDPDRPRRRGKARRDRRRHRRPLRRQDVLHVLDSSVVFRRDPERTASAVLARVQRRGTRERREPRDAVVHVARRFGPGPFRSFADGAHLDGASQPSRRRARPEHRQGRRSL